MRERRERHIQHVAASLAAADRVDVLFLVDITGSMECVLNVSELAGVGGWAIGLRSWRYLRGLMGVGWKCRQHVCQPLGWLGLQV